MIHSSPLANPIFRKLFGAQLVALFGTGLSTIALALLANELAGANAGQVLGIALAIKMIAYVFLAPLIAAFANRFDTKRMLVFLDIVRALVIGAMFFVSEAWHIYILVFVLNAANAGFTPLFQASIPRILSDDVQYTKALSLSRLAYDLENIISPLAAGAMLLFMSFNNFFALNAVAFLFSAMLVISSGLPAVPSEASHRASALSGIIAFLRTPRLRALLCLKLIVSLAGSVVIVNSVVLIVNIMGLNEQYLAIALAWYGLGSITAAFAVPKMLNVQHDRTLMLLGGFLLITGLVLATTMPKFFFLCAIWLILGVGNGLILTPTGRLLKRSSSNENRSAIFAAHFSLSHACWLFAYPLAGWLPLWMGHQNYLWWFVSAGVLALAAAAWIWKPVNAKALTHTHEAFDHDHMHVHDEHHDHEHEGWEGPEPHSHPHHHMARTHAHNFVIDAHHHHWPQ